MNVYHYIAESNPDAANEVCKKYGYFQINSLDELGTCLQNIVAQNGEDGLKDVMDLHPDKEVLFELFDKKKEEFKPQLVEQEEPKDCSCSTKKNASGEAASLTSNTNLYIVLGAVIVSLAIISLSKSKS